MLLVRSRHVMCSLRFRQCLCLSKRSLSFLSMNRKVLNGKSWPIFFFTVTRPTIGRRCPCELLAGELRICPPQNSGWGCAAQFSKPYQYFTPNIWFSRPFSRPLEAAFNRVIFAMVCSLSQFVWKTNLPGQCQNNKKEMKMCDLVLPCQKHTLFQT